LHGITDAPCSGECLVGRYVHLCLSMRRSRETAASL
jgi:hypothetical protein